MYNSALRIVNKVPDAEDILQEAFTDAFLQLKTLQRKSTFGGWLKQIIIFKSISFLKKKHIHFADIENIAEPGEPEVDEQDTSATIGEIKLRIRDLPDGYRTVLSLYLLEGYDHEEIAEIMGITHSTVRTQYSRAKQKLLKLLNTKNE
jgi:RNA polymerase sigma-70 factor (ECF subfamily)